MPFSSDYSFVRLQRTVAGVLLAASWLLGAAQCLVAPTASCFVCVGRSRIAASRSRLTSHTANTRVRYGGPRLEALKMAMPGGGRRAGGGGGGRGGGRGRGRGRGAPPPDAFALTGEERLQKFLSHAGLDSRRQCEQMILDGRVRVNGKMVKELGVKVDPRRDQIHVDGNRVFMRPSSEIKWVALNKPKGVICTVSDELGRPTAVSVVPRGREMRLVPVGRLDRDSCGLLLMTNENSWINPLTHPSYGHEKTYRVSITSGYPNPEEWNTLTQGMLLDGDPNPTRPCIVEVVDFDRRSLVTTVDIIIREGKNRQIRRMFEGIGHDVRSITRISHGPIRLKDLRPGEWRALEQWEVEKLKNLTTKTLKSPQKLAPSPTRGDSRNRAGPGARVSSGTSQQYHQETHRRDVLDDEEDEWNKTGAWDRSGVRKAAALPRGSGSNSASNRKKPQPEPVSEEDYEWQTASWARKDDRQPQGGKGRGGRAKGKGERKARMTEGDLILDKLAKGEKLKAPSWEGDGKVERERRSLGKGSWSRRGGR